MRFNVDHRAEAIVTDHFELARSEGRNRSGEQNTAPDCANS